MASDSTEELPARFDKYGRRLPERGENDLADRFEEILKGRGGGVGRFLKHWGLGTGNDAEGRAAAAAAATEESSSAGGSGSGRRRRRRER